MSRTSSDAARAPAPPRVAGPRPVILGVALFLAALNLRAAIASVPPLVDRIEADLGLSAAVAGVLTTLPVACMGVFAPAAQRIAHRLGREATIGWALLSIASGALVRLGGGSVTVLFAGTFLAGVGIAVAQTMLPGVVKEHFADRGGLMTGVYSTAMALGATVAAGVTVPLEHATGSWQRSLAVWTAPALLGLIVWPAVTGPLRTAVSPGAALGAVPTAAARPPTPATWGLPWRSRTAWLISLYLGLQSLLFYSVLSWLAPLYQLHGWSPTRSGIALSVFNLVGVVASPALPTLAERQSERRPWFVLAVGCSAVGLTAVAAAPTTEAWLWIVLLGFGLGGGFPLGLLLLVDHARDAGDSARLSAMAFLVAYSLAAVGPVLTGALRDLTGAFDEPFLVLAGLALTQLLVASTFSPKRRGRGL